MLSKCMTSVGTPQSSYCNYVIIKMSRSADGHAKVATASSRRSRSTLYKSHFSAIIFVIKPLRALPPSSVLTKTYFALDFLFTIHTQQAAA